MSRKKFNGPKDVRAIEVLLYSVIIKILSEDTQEMVQ